VTEGAPTRTDAKGNPVLPYLTLKGTPPEGVEVDTIERWISMRGLQIQVVFTPLGLWQLPKKSGGKISGVKARINALLVTVGRTGQAVALYSPR
jgi:hypothetical protein